MSIPTIIAWSWGEDAYHEAAEQLVADCERHGYAHDIEIGVDLSDHLRWCPDPDRWEERQWAYRYIPHFIARKMMSSQLGRPVLYLHADMRIRQPIPEDAFTGMDVGLESGWSQYPPRPEDRVLAAPVYLRNNPAAYRFLHVWRALCRWTDDGRGEHEQLLHAWRVFSHPRETCRVGIFDPPLGSIRADSDVPIVGTK